MSTFTKSAIKQSFMQLLNKKPLNKITIKEIVENCGLNRNTFYYHFDDLPSLLEEILLDEINNLLENQDEMNSIFDCLINGFDFALQNKKAVMHIYDSSNKDMFDFYIDKIAYIAVEKYITKASSEYKISSSDKEAIIMYYKCLLSGFVEDWIKKGMRYDLRTKIERICELYDGSMETAFRRCAQSAEKSNQTN